MEPLLILSGIGVYLHAIFVSITLGFPFVIIGLLVKYSRTGEMDYLKTARLMTSVLAVNFALGAITGTLVEFGLVQAWPGTIIAIASFAFTPLALELVAFANEIAFLVLFIITLGKIRATYSILILAIYWVFAVFSGVLITAVNAWLLVPWGTGEIAKAIYPFMPEFGENAVDIQKLLALKIIAIASEMPIQAIIQNLAVAEKVGVVLFDPFIAFNNPFAIASILHNITAAILVGISIALVGYAISYYRKGEERHLKVVKICAILVFVLFLIQPTIFGHFMGEGVVKFNPTKFAMMENAYQTYQNPLVAFLAYGDPSKPLIGFDEFKRDCEELGNTKLGEVAGSVGLSKEGISKVAAELGTPLAPHKLDAVWNTEVRQLCLADVERAMEKVWIVHTAYYTKIFFGMIGFLSSIALFAYLRRTAEKLSSRYIIILSILVMLGSIIPSVLGWYVREVGRKPWTVYGLLYPEELVTVVEYARTTEFGILFGAIILSIAIIGIYAMFLVATRELKFLDLLRGEKR